MSINTKHNPQDTPECSNENSALYIHRYACISPQRTTGTADLEHVLPSGNGKLLAQEPTLENVPAGMLRRMSKAVRMGVGVGLPILQENKVDGIIVGTANGGMEDCIKFLNQIIDYDEGMLTPANFVQSTPNALAGQLSLATRNHCYNATHVHLGLAFENALTDARMLVQAQPETQLLVGGVDEISTYNYNIDFLAGWYDKTLNSRNLYEADIPATIAGEGAAMFLVGGMAKNAMAKIESIDTVHTTDVEKIKNRVELFLKKNKTTTSETLFISGENGDKRFTPFYAQAAAATPGMPVVRFKHLCGEYPTASAFALWLACHAIAQQQLPEHLFKNNLRPNGIKQVLVYNIYHGRQHSLILVSKT